MKSPLNRDREAEIFHNNLAQPSYVAASYTTFDLRETELAPREPTEY